MKQERGEQRQHDGHRRARAPPADPPQHHALCGFLTVRFAADQPISRPSSPRCPVATRQTPIPSPRTVSSRTCGTQPDAIKLAGVSERGTLPLPPMGRWVLDCSQFGTDDQLLDRLGELAAIVDPVPREVQASARSLFARRSTKPVACGNPVGGQAELVADVPAPQPSGASEPSSSQ